MDDPEEVDEQAISDDDDQPLQPDDFDLVVGSLGIDPRLPPVDFESGAGTNQGPEATNTADVMGADKGPVPEADMAAVEELLQRARELVGCNSLDTAATVATATGLTISCTLCLLQQQSCIPQEKRVV